MKLYREVLIESAEQAEALPLWTTARIEKHPQDGLPMIAMRIVRGWRNRDLVDGRISHADMVGWSALVPIEAEEETVRPMSNEALGFSFGPDDELPDWFFDGPPRTRLVTPWTPASD